MNEESETDQLRRHLRQMTVLHQVSTRIVSTLDPDQVVTSVLGSLPDLVSYRSASVYLEGRALTGESDETPNLVVPLIAGGRSIGALRLWLGDALDADDVKVLELLATTAAVALQNAHLYQETQRLATTDALTGLSNYRHFHELLVLEVQRARRMAYPLGLLIMDLDHFKLVNDRHGHPAGDLALKIVGEQLRNRLRGTDVIARIGGEEFAAILPGDGPQEVAVVAEKLRQAIEELPPVRDGVAEDPLGEPVGALREPQDPLREPVGALREPQDPLREPVGALREPQDSTSVTLSVGGASLGPDVADAQLLLTCADRALYEAKRNGRNQVRLFRE